MPDGREATRENRIILFLGVIAPADVPNVFFHLPDGRRSPEPLSLWLVSGGSF